MSTAPSTPVDYDAIDGALGERYYKDSKDLEEQYTDEIIDVIRRALDKGLSLSGECRVRGVDRKITQSTLATARQIRGGVNEHSC
jgi:hypothetical protein